MEFWRSLGCDHVCTQRGKLILIMKLRSIISIGLIVVVSTHQALAQEGKSRAQVRAELDEAILNQLRPDLYPRVAQRPGKSRRTGDIVAGESPYRFNGIPIPICTHPWPCFQAKLARR
jgi:hypothetical protein